VGGLTFNGENNDTDYRNGVDGHIDWAASQFLNEQVHIGLVGYFYHHLSGGQRFRCDARRFQITRVRRRPASRLFLPRREREGLRQPQGILGIRRANRADGWNVWVSLLLPLDVGR
jgi:hypothetical protein